MAVAEARPARGGAALLLAAVLACYEPCGAVAPHRTAAAFGFARAGALPCAKRGAAAAAVLRRAPGAGGRARPDGAWRGLLQHVSMTMLGPRPNGGPGGDDDKDVSRRLRPDSSAAQSVVVPEEVSRRELRFCLLQVRAACALLPAAHRGRARCCLPRAVAARAACCAASC